MKQNYFITGYALKEAPTYLSVIEKNTNSAWSYWGLKSNHKRHGIITEIYRYFLYFFFPVLILIKCRNAKNIITTQQFYGLIVAFYLKLMRQKKHYTITVLTFIYKRKVSIIGDIYFKFIKFIVNSKYIDAIVVYSENEVDYYTRLFNCRKGLFHYVQLGKEDESKNVTSEKGDYLIAIGRSNRDYRFLIDTIEGTDYKLIIVNDSFKDIVKNPNIKILKNCHDRETIKLIAKSFCVIVPLLDPNISAGQLVVLQAQNLCKPVIATKSKGIANYIINGKTGFIIKKIKKNF